MEETLGIEATDKEHVMSHKEGKEPLALVESCPYVRDLSVAEASRFLQRQGFCRVCLHRNTNEFHKEEKCRFTQVFHGLKCAEKKCNLRYTMCDEHTNKNKIKLEGSFFIYDLIPILPSTNSK